MKRWKTFTAGALALAFLAGIVHAHEGAMGIVKERMDSMEDVRKATKVVADMVRGKSAYERAAVMKAAAQIAREAERMPPLFPKGSLDKPTEASPAIWKNWAEFERLANEMGVAAKALGAKARAGADIKEIGVATRDLTRTCAACHKKFRLSK